jgi:hypothetical protein
MTIYYNFKVSRVACLPKREQWSQTRRIRTRLCLATRFCVRATPYRVRVPVLAQYVGLKSPLLSYLYKGSLVAVLLYVFLGLVLVGKGYLTYETPIGMIR